MTSHHVFTAVQPNLTKDPFNACCPPCAPCSFHWGACPSKRRRSRRRPVSVRLLTQPCRLLSLPLPPPPCPHSHSNPQMQRLPALCPAGRQPTMLAPTPQRRRGRPVGLWALDGRPLPLRIHPRHRHRHSRRCPPRRRYPAIAPMQTPRRPPQRPSPPPPSLSHPPRLGPVRLRSRFPPAHPPRPSPQPLCPRHQSLPPPTALPLPREAPPASAPHRRPPSPPPRPRRRLAPREHDARPRCLLQRRAIRPTAAASGRRLRSGSSFGRPTTCPRQSPSCKPASCGPGTRTRVGEGSDAGLAP
mmetsp:Transcript_15585/g.50882  ORF Transcript_15585/g.50882 Transcript_15585/m.50882 type:complete len:301 (+) Transcript_15585:242-1144(+)|eukprot:scaffold4364_cov119-Isochrysis_galbana.AAC.8